MSQIFVLNAGGQYCHLIARRIRELGVHASVVDIAVDPKDLRDARGIVISGGPHSVRDVDSPRVREGLYELGKPILGICYGHQLLARDLGGDEAVVSGVSKEYGETPVCLGPESSMLLDQGRPRITAWMSHGDTVVKLPPGFLRTAHTVDCEVAAMENPARRVFGLQFHPEVAHTEHGTKMLERFVFGIAGCVPDWDPRKRVGEVIRRIKEQVGGRGVFFLISGGIDSTVAFQLCLQALPPGKVRGLYVDTGLMRKTDTRDLRAAFPGINENVLHVTDRSQDFISALHREASPERKRRIIGDLFMVVQEEEFARLGLASEGEWLIGQGTIYPDTIESGGTRHAAKIKTHHNRVERVQELIAQGRVVEPLVEFYKDEVRVLAQELQLPDEIVHKHPFPGPGLAVRCLCSDVEQPVRDLSTVVGRERIGGIGGWVIPIRTVGVQGDERSYSELAAITVQNNDLVAAGASSRVITNQVRSINRVGAIVYTRPGVAFGDLQIHKACVSRERLATLREADDIVHTVIREQGWYRRIWQFPVALLPLGSHESRETVVLRPVRSKDGMTADFVPLPAPIVQAIVSRLALLPAVDAVLYDVTNKPPATIELE